MGNTRWAELRTNLRAYSKSHIQGVTELEISYKKQTDLNKLTLVQKLILTGKKECQS